MKSCVQASGNRKRSRGGAWKVLTVRPLDEQCCHRQLSGIGVMGAGDDDDEEEEDDDDDGGCDDDELNDEEDEGDIVDGDTGF